MQKAARSHARRRQWIERRCSAFPNFGGSAVKASLPSCLHQTCQCRVAASNHLCRILHELRRFCRRSIALLLFSAIRGRQVENPGVKKAVCGQNQLATLGWNSGRLRQSPL